MADRIWRGTTPAVAQVDTLTPANVEIADIFTATLTADDGTTAAVSFTATAGTVANVTAGLTAAINASTHPYFQRLTATDNTTYIAVTADEAGVPFSLAGSTTDGGGTNNQTLTRAASVANSGPNSYAVANNWIGDAVPTTGDNVWIPAGTPDILYGLNQSSVSIGTFERDRGATNRVGRFEDGKLYYLRLDPGSNRVYLGGSGGLTAVDVGSATSSPIIDQSGPAYGDGLHAVYVKGSAIVNVHMNGGVAAIAGFDGDTATVTGLFQLTAGVLTVGPGTTVAGTTANIAGASRLRSFVSIPTVNGYGDGVMEQLRGVWTTYVGWGRSTAYADAAGTYATTTLYGEQATVRRRTLQAVVFTTTTVNGGTRTQLPAPGSAVTYTNATTQSGADQVDLSSGT